MDMWGVKFGFVTLETEYSAALKNSISVVQNTIDSVP
jgi:hypothetical protein